MEHHAPHAGAAFEGYYNKFSLPSGAHLVIVICKVNGARSRANLVTLTYVPTAHHDADIYQREIVTGDIEMKRTEAGDHAFILKIPELGHAEWKSNSSSEFHFQHEAFSFEATVASAVPWTPLNNTPEGWLVRLPLPLHWHVQSLASPCKFHLAIPGYDLPVSDMSGQVTVHQEKNWATSFPSAHIWIQCRERDRGFCCAGGKILGMEAFLLAYHSADLNVEFRPPFALRFLGIGPFMSYKVDWENRSVDLVVQSFRKKIEVHAKAPKGSFFPLSSPFPEGHRANLLNQSFQAKVDVKVYRSSFLGPWKMIRVHEFENGSLEFGGAFYRLAGSSDQFN